jgi:hypothetical protein
MDCRSSAIEHHQSARVAGNGGMLSDQIRRQLVVKKRHGEILWRCRAMPLAGELFGDKSFAVRQVFALLRSADQ